MKTTIDIPDELFRRAKATAALQGISLRELLTETLRQRLATGRPGRAASPPWMTGFGELEDLRAETRRIQALIEDEFEKVGPEEKT